jgi:niacin transporter
MTTRKLVLTSLFVAIGIVLPQTFHLIGGPSLGSMLLPMHIPVFIGAMLLGPISGLIIALASVIIGVFLGMPPIIIASYMIFELSIYALVSGYLYYNKEKNVYIAYFVAKTLGMATAFVAITIMLNVFGLSSPMLTGSISMFYVGIPGIIIQIILIPTIITLLKRNHITDGL